MNQSNFTLIDHSHVLPTYVGYIGVLVAVGFFGSFLVPAQKLRIHDSFSYQFFMSVGIWTTGLLINLILQSTVFFPLVLIGGFLWASGNILSLHVIQINGVGLSMLLWSTTNVLLGWASGRWGWFGLMPDKIFSPYLNYVGVAITCVSGLIFFNIKTDKQKIESDTKLNGNVDVMSLTPLNEGVEVNPTIQSSSKKLYTRKFRLLASLLAIIAGSFFGLTFTPSTYIQHHPEKYPYSSNNGLDYCFSMYSGVLLTSFVYYSFNIIIKHNQPFMIESKTIFPAFSSGIMWGLGQAGFLVANSVLNQAIAFPLVIAGPSCVAVIWALFYFKDMSGIRNYVYISVGIILRIGAAILIVFSKQKIL
ncbi:unnamed protein product [Didymodactylos carnosus]|uniref:Transmembrane protein 144 n=1 Tax=Didymodactylos carnosus TaxID=1234261 RepID=A0A815PXC5_9BILA|nr:unnamed protein product [Didymodactylos carnosus]CAF1502335.1 unnamed protein product [Didymodactylos carnosus]CAF4290749.1 unnamed protein product [Didymodactylos carnosus]CAF4327107.1 unnamed protein product [Didymodactylos carnosus]